MKKWINIDISKLPFRKKKIVVEELLDIYTTEYYCTNKNEYRRVFKIPIGGLSEDEAKEQLQKSMKVYNTDVKWDESNGEILLPINKELDKEIWYPVDEKKNYNFFKRLFGRFK